ncbi:heavy-metal-associated domain-containing protein [Effusibacillus consociatus]|uniref:Heavy-metal-associated domain-containing protein n=1 Tax=Effusibacillus consociatus TaxID=1117041 RepID=A0ABV9Q0R3_9BACL
MSLGRIMIRKSAPEEVRRVSTSLNALTGVDRAVIDPVANTITVEFDDQVVNLNQLRKTVQAAGIDVLSEWKEPF